MLTSLIGPDRYSVAQALKALLTKHAPASQGLGEFNVSRLDGARVAPDELGRAVQSIGFFGEKRVVVVEGLLSRFGGGRGADEEAGTGAKTRAEERAASGRGRKGSEPGLGEQFAQVLAQVPESTVLILLERGGAPKSSALYRAAVRYGKIEEFIPPKGMALERWIGNYCKELGVKITPGAQAALASTLPDLQTLANELDKLSLYVGKGGLIDERVLREMSYTSKQDDVFEMTSAAAQRDTRRALAQLHRLVDGGTSPEGILPVLAWQIRTLIQVRDLLDRRVPEGRMAQASGLSDYVLRKSIGQARQFSMQKLLEVHQKLLELDHGVKTGRADAELSLDALIVEMCQAR